MLRSVPGDGAASGRWDGQAEDAALQWGEELIWRGVGEQFTLVQQQHSAAARGLVEIGGGPDHGDPVGAAFFQHRRDDRPEFAA
jgi:hypothetical protein